MPLQLPALNGKDIPYEFTAELDDCLLRAFTQRVTEPGISFEAAPVLRTIQGGQPSTAA